MIELPEPLAVILILIVCVAVTFMLVRDHEQKERQILVFAGTMHIAFGLILKWSTSETIFSEGDAWFYRDYSNGLVEIARSDPFYCIPQLFRALLRLHNDFGFKGDDPTENMVPATALGRLVTFDSFYALYAFIGWLGFLSKWGVYAVLRDELKGVDRRYLGLAVMCVPSVVFWTCGVVKEGFALLGFGPLMWGARLIVKKRWVRGALFALAGAWVVAAFKPYVLFPFGVGVSVWIIFDWSPRARNHAFTYLTIGIMVGSLAVFGLSALFPQFSPQELTQTTASLQMYGEQTEGGSNFQINTADRSLSGQLTHAPLALLTTLTRPAIWEVHNVPALIASLEMLALTLLFLRGLIKGGTRALREAFTNPVALFSIVYTMLGATAIGLATTNFGTLSRYRVPIMPFYCVLVVVFTLNVEAGARRRVAAVPPATGALGRVLGRRVGAGLTRRPPLTPPSSRG